MPQFAVDPGDAGDDALGFDGAEDLTRFGIDLMDLAGPMLPDPERALGPGKTRIATISGGRDGGEHLAARRIDLLDAILGDLVEMLAIEGGSGVRGDIDRARRCACRGIQRVELVA